jgi:hypothetical protein
VESHPREPGLLGLLNLSDQVWQAELDDGASLPLPPGQRGNLRRIRVLRTPWGLVHCLNPPSATSPVTGSHG